MAPAKQNRGCDIPFLDPSDPAFSIRSEAVLRARESSWWARTPYGLAVLRYAEMKQMIHHPLLRQGSYRWPEHNQAGGSWAQWWRRMMLNREGADHARLRRLGAPAFAPRLVAGMIPRFQALADELIRSFEGQGKCEFMSRFAEPYATRVVCELVGVPHSRWQEFAELAVTMGLALGVTYARDEAAINAATERFFAIAEQIVDERRRAPRDDFISALINANEDKDTLSDQELYDMIVLSIFGGIDTTRSQIGLAMAMFIEHPDQWALLGDNPDLARAAVEEVMRLRPTTTWVTREAIEDFEFNGVPIAKGTTIHLFSSAAGSDPEHFTPGFDITVKRKPHFGFGGGRHHCIGSQIARGDMTEALKLLAQRLKNPVYDGEPQWLPDSGNTGPVSLPMAFDSSAIARPGGRQGI